jgi:hypothetical protein
MIRTIDENTFTKYKYEARLFKIQEKLANIRYINNTESWSTLKELERQVETKLRAINILILSKTKRK